MSDVRREFDAPKEHYTAVIEIHHVVPEQVIKNTYNDTKPVPKTNRDVARIVVRAKDLDKLIEKTNAHLLLVEDE